MFFEFLKLLALATFWIMVVILGLWALGIIVSVIVEQVRKYRD